MAGTGATGTSPALANGGTAHVLSAVCVLQIIIFLSPVLDLKSGKTKVWQILYRA